MAGPAGNQLINQPTPAGPGQYTNQPFRRLVLPSALIDHRGAPATAWPKAGEGVMSVPEWHRRACEWFAGVVGLVRPEQWTAPTPCREWDVRTLVNHVVGENLWTVPLMAGRTIAEVGDRFEGDLLGPHPASAAERAAADAVVAVGEAGVMTRTVHLSCGDESGEEYARQLLTDNLVHGWELARAIGAADRMDPELVTAVADWYAGREELYRGAGLIADRPETVHSADPQARLLAAFGRDPDWSPLLAAVQRFNEAFNAHDVDRVMAAMTEDCVFESTAPPDGERHEGAAAVRAYWQRFFADSPEAHFDEVESFAAGDRAVVRWRYTWGRGDVQGVDVMRIRDGKVAEKIAYVKG
jgi:uncharacterized protein (TIGR03086 family)